MSLVDWLHLTLEKWLFVGDVLCIPAAHSPLVIRAICYKHAPYVDCMAPSLMEGCLTWVVWLAWLAPRPVGCWTLPCAQAASCCLAGLGHKVTGCRTPGGPRASAGSLMSRARFWGGWLWGLGIRTGVGPLLGRTGS